MRFRLPPSPTGSEVLKRGRKPEVMVSEGFGDWLLANRLSLAFTEKVSGLLFFVGIGEDGEQLSISQVAPPLGCETLWSDGRRLWLASSRHLQGFKKNSTKPGHCFESFLSVTTGPLNVQDIILDSMGRPIVASAQENGLVTLSFTSPFQKIWHPSFLTSDTNRDCCHLSGMAHDGREIRYVTLFCQSTTESGWKSRYEKAGVLMDIRDQSIVAGDLTLPCAPRFYRNQIWLLNSGLSELGVIESKTRKFLPLFRCPGYPTSLAFHGHHALIGLSSTVSGLRPFQQESGDEASQSGLILFDIEKARMVHWIRVRSPSVQVESVAFLTNSTWPITLTMGQKID